MNTPAALGEPFSAGPAPFVTRQVRDFAEFTRFLESSAAELATRQTVEQSLITGETFFVEGQCGVCRRPASFWVDFDYAPPQTPRAPNWRERLCCGHCSLNNRMRAALHYLDHSLAGADGVVYVTEQTTMLYAVLARRYPGAIGSEFCSDGTAPGAPNAGGIRFEDVTALTFDTASLDAVLTFDVLEHVPNYRKAISEFARCLRPGGHLIMTVPFVLHNAATVVRARVRDDGSVEHLLPPEMHGDPLRSEGILAYYNFGWDLLDEMRQSGFPDVAAHFYWSLELGYLGGLQFLIHARR